MIRVASSAFIPLAENCSPLQTQRDAKGEFFRLVAEQGHYAGRTVPSATRQGQYAFSADGHLLSSINTREAQPMLGMLTQALERWAALSTDTADTDGATASAATPAAPAPYKRDARHPDFYPAGGLVLKQTLRDLPRPAAHASPQNRPQAINFDYAWFRAEELPGFLPETLEVGAQRDLPRALVRRLARFHLLDSVRGETPPWRDEDVEAAHIRSTVTGIDGSLVRLRLDGAVRNGQRGMWAVRAFREKLEGMSRGYDCRLRGELTFNTQRGAFERFDLVAAGDRWGGTEHNGRSDDLSGGPMGVVFQLAGSAPADRTPPHANLWDYFDVPAAQRPT